MGTVTKALELLDLFTREQPLIGLSDLARQSGQNKATCFRMMTEMQALGLVEQTGPSKAYRLGPAVLRLAALREAAVPTRDAAMPVVQNLANHLKEAGIRVKLDDDDTKRPGWKFAEWELKGVPVRIVLGARDLENRVMEIARRDTKEKASVPMEGSLTYVQNLLAEIQQNLFARAAATRTANTHHVNTYDEMKAVLAGEGSGFCYAHWDGTAETAEKIKEETKATIRCMPMGVPDEAGVCVYSGKPSARRVIFAKAY